MRVHDHVTRGYRAISNLNTSHLYHPIDFEARAIASWRLHEGNSQPPGDPMQDRPRAAGQAMHRNGEEVIEYQGRRKAHTGLFAIGRAGDFY